MPVVYDATTMTARMTATRDQVAAGTLEIQAANDTVLAIFTLSGSGGSVSGSTWTLGFAAATVSAAATGVATKARIKNSGGTVRITGLTVGMSGSGADFIFDNTSIAITQQVTMTSATITDA